MNKTPETITRASEARHVHKKINADNNGVVTSAEFALVTLRLEPLPRGSGLQFVNAAKEHLNPDHVAGVEAGVKAASERGVIAEGPVVDIRATLLAGVYHQMDSNWRTFMLAGREAFWEAMRNAGPTLVQ